MIEKISFTISGSNPKMEASAHCEFVIDGQDTKLSAAQFRRLQDVCLAVLDEQGSLTLQTEGDSQHAKTGSVKLRQFARLYRAACRIPGYDLEHLQNLCLRLHHKPLAELSMFELANITGMLNAVIKGMVDIKQVLKEPVELANGCAGKRFA